jgi:hypothetical protein
VVLSDIFKDFAVAKTRSIKKTIFLEAMTRNLTPEVLHVNIDEYHAFIQQSHDIAQCSPDLSQLKDDILLKTAAMIASALFRKKIEVIKKALSDPETAIIAIDIAESKNLNPNENAYWGAVIALALGSNAFHLAKDGVNQTPYTIYAASYNKSKELATLGLDTVAPETKLGFHTDGMIGRSGVYMPHNIMLYNIIIEYKNPGNFYWVPFALWRERKLFMDQLGVGKRYRIKVTPSVYDLGGGMLKMALPQEVEAPIFVQDESNNNPLYINGQVTGRVGDDKFNLSLIDELKESISKNEIRYAVPQRNRRVIFACNLKGAHARDIFEKPTEGVPFTRVFMRSVDANVIDLNN